MTTLFVTLWHTCKCDFISGCDGNVKISRHQQLFCLHAFAKKQVRSVEAKKSQLFLNQYLLQLHPCGILFIYFLIYLFLFFLLGMQKYEPRQGTMLKGYEVFHFLGHCWLCSSQLRSQMKVCFFSCTSQCIYGIFKISFF